MPFIAECPFCKKGRLNCSDRSVGWSATCPNPECGLSFTIVKSSLAPAATPSGPRRRPRIPQGAPKSAATQSPLAPAAAAPSSPLSLDKESGRPDAPEPGCTDRLPPSSAPPSRESAARIPSRPQTGTAGAAEDQEEERSGNRWPINALAVTSIVCAGAALAWASFGLELIVALVAGGLAAVVGLVGLQVARNRECGVALAAIGPISAVLALLVVALLLFNPRWGLESRPDSAASRERHVVPLKPSAGVEAPRKPGAPSSLSVGGSALAPEWVDASKGAVQFGDDLWLRVTGVTVAPVELGRSKRFTEERWLVVRLQAANNGTFRRIDYAGWADSDSGTSAHRAVLRDSAGRVLRQKTFAADALPTGQLKSGVIMPGKWLDDLLVFEPPAEGFTALRLELPLSAFGMEGKAQWHIPRSMIVFK